MPRAHVRLSAGREEMSDELQALCFLAGANSIFYGEKLLTTGNPDVERDRRLFARLGLTAQGHEAGPATLEGALAQLEAAQLRRTRLTLAPLGHDGRRIVGARRGRAHRLLQQRLPGTGAPPGAGAGAGRVRRAQAAPAAAPRTW